ncbi:MAG: TIM barrel protein [Chloroflexia bacterium]|nr:TIM barrel protein [Chloroflexia bacterium]
MTALELNFPRHVLDFGKGELDALLIETGLPMTALNLRLDDLTFRRGAFTAPEQQTRLEARRIAQDAVDCAARYSAGHVVLWMADDGWDYPFQTDYGAIWQAEIEGFRSVADRNPAIRVSVEYKPREPRRFSLIRSMADALLAANEVNRPNFGVTIDVCHSYMAGEHPPAAAAAALAAGKLFGVHLNDGYGPADDGLIVASVHQRDTLELIHVLKSGSYDGTIYFDTFPIREEPEEELAANIATVQRLLRRLDHVNLTELTAAQSAQDALAVARVLGAE